MHILQAKVSSPSLQQSMDLQKQLIPVLKLADRAQTPQLPRSFVKMAL